MNSNKRNKNKNKANKKEEINLENQKDENINITKDEDKKSGNDSDNKNENTNVNTLENENKENIVDDTNNTKQQPAVSINLEDSSSKKDQNLKDQPIVDIKQEKEQIIPEIEKRDSIEKTCACDEKIPYIIEEKTESDNNPQTEIYNLNTINQELLQNSLAKNNNLLVNTEQISPKSKNSDYNDIFSSSQQSNAKRIQSQIVELQSKAGEYAGSLIELSQQFEKMKLQLKYSSNRLFNSLFSFFGYKYNSTVLHPNLFFLIAQAWLISLGRLLQSYYSIDAFAKLSFSNILEIIKNNQEKQGITQEDENTFMNDLGILTGNLLLEKNQSSSYSLIQSNIGKNFLQSLSFFIINEYHYENNEINKEEFEQIILTFFTKAFEKTLNIEMQTGLCSFVDFTLVYDYFKKIEKNVCLETYQNYIIDNYTVKLERPLNTFEFNEAKICSEAFYEFSKYSVSDILNELQIFIQNYSSIFFKLKSLLSKSLQGCSNFKNNAINIYQRIFSFECIQRSNKSLKETFYMVNHNFIKSLAKTVKLGDTRVRRMKLWLDESYDYLMQLHLMELSSRVMTKTFLLPFYLTIRVFNFTIDQSKIGYEKFLIIKNKILLLMDNFFINSFLFLKGQIQNIKNLIKIVDLGEKIKIKINRNFFSYVYLPDIRGMLIAIFSIFKMYYEWTQEISIKIRQKGIEKIKNFLDYVIVKKSK